MPIKKYLKKMLPDIDHLGFHSKPSRIRTYLLNPMLWHINRRSISKGVAIGLFIAFAPLPMQMLLACLLAIFFRANLPIALALTWISNPITFVPINFFIYKVGRLFVYDAGLQDLQSFTFKGKSFLEIATYFIHWIQNTGKPFLVGTPIVMVSSSVIGYFAVRLAWRFSVMIRMRQRHIKNSCD